MHFVDEGISIFEKCFEQFGENFIQTPSLSQRGHKITKRFLTLSFGLRLEFVKCERGVFLQNGTHKMGNQSLCYLHEKQSRTYSPQHIVFSRVHFDYKYRIVKLYLVDAGWKSYET